MWCIYDKEGTVVGTSNALPNIEDLKTYEYEVLETAEQLDIATTKYRVVDGKLLQEAIVQKNYDVRGYRDALMNKAQALINRYDNQKRLGYTPTDSDIRIKALLQYMQVLRDIPAIYKDKAVEDISWPEMP